MIQRPSDEALRELLREKSRSKLINFTTYTKPDYKVAWHNQLLCHYLDLFVAKKIRRLIVSMPPRHGKSEATSRRLPAYIFGKNPNSRIIASTYSKSLASSNNRDVQRIIDSEKYRELFPSTTLSQEGFNGKKAKIARNNELFEIVNHTGYYRCAGVGGALTGFGADFLLIDDPIKNHKEANSIVMRQMIWDWWVSTASTRLESDGCALVTMTRWHEGDLVGRLLDLAKNDPQADQWMVLVLPAIKESRGSDDMFRGIDEPLWPEMYPLEQLLKFKAANLREFNALYQQRPTALEGGIIKEKWLENRFYTVLPDGFDQVIQSWDFSFKDTQNSDFVVGQVWGRKGANKYLLYQTRGRFSFTESCKELERVSKLYPMARIKIVEEKANGAAIIDALKNKITGIIPYRPTESKQARLSAVAPDFEAGNVWLPSPSIAPWIVAYVEELKNFPNALNDDQVDSTSQALLRFNGKEDYLSKISRL